MSVFGETDTAFHLLMSALSAVLLLNSEYISLPFAVFQPPMFRLNAAAWQIEHRVVNSWT